MDTTLIFKKAQARSKEHKALKSKRKKHIQKLLKAKLSIIVDVVRPGAETLNTRNVARLFFDNPKIVAECNGINENLIVRFRNILQVISCNSMINCEAIKVYCEDTYKMCISEYGWYKMSPTVHKLLIHGSDIINYFNVPFGWLSEEHQEGNNKIFRKQRLEHCRMRRRISSNEDIMNNWMVLSDVLISSLRRKVVAPIKPIKYRSAKTIM